MKTAFPTLRRIALLSIGILSVSAFAAITSAVNPGNPVPAFTSSAALSQQVRLHGQKAGVSVATPSTANDIQLPPATRETLDHARWNHGGDANANDVALFRRVIASGDDDGNTALTSISLIALLFGGLAFGHRQGKKTRIKARQRPYFAA